MAVGTLIPYEFFKRSQFAVGREPIRLGDDGEVTHLGAYRAEIDYEVLRAMPNRNQFMILAEKKKYVSRDGTIVDTHGHNRPEYTYTQWASGVGAKTINNTGTAIPVSDTDLEPHFNVNDTLFIDSPDESTNFEVKITEVDRTSHTITVANAQTGDTTAHVLNDDKRHLLVFGSSQWADGSGYGEGPTQLTSQKQNYCQIMKGAVEEVGAMTEVDSTIREDKWEEQKRIAMEQFILDMQNQFLFSSGGYRGDTSLNALKPIGMNGLITTNKFVVPAELTEDHMWGLMERAFDRQENNSQKWGLCTNVLIWTLQTVLRDRLILNDSVDKETGMKYKRWTTPFGDINLMPNSYYRDTNWHLNATMAGDPAFNGGFLLAIDDAMIKQVQFGGRGLQWINNVQLAGHDLKTDIIFADMGISYPIEETAALLCFKKPSTFSDIGTYHVGSTGDFDTSDLYDYSA